MNNGKIPIKRLDIVGHLIIPVPVIDFDQSSFKDLSGAVDVEVEL
jgi:hypothetical protein